jgi:hypothetical protein
LPKKTNKTAYRKHGLQKQAKKQNKKFQFLKQKPGKKHPAKRQKEFLKLKK